MPTCCSFRKGILFSFSLPKQETQDSRRQSTQDGVAVSWQCQSQDLQSGIWLQNPHAAAMLQSGPRNMDQKAAQGASKPRTHELGKSKFLFRVSSFSHGCLALIVQGLRCTIVCPLVSSGRSADTEDKNTSFGFCPYLFQLLV